MGAPIVGLVLCILVTAGCSPGEKPTERQPVVGADPSRGRVLLSQYQCGACHTIPEVPSSRGMVSSSLEGFGRRSYIAGRLANRHELLARWIEDPQAMVPDTPMPSMGVTPQDARDMAAYLLTLQ
jgi:cytochrome c